MLEMPVVRYPVSGAVLAHRRHRNPIGKGVATEGQLDRRRFEAASGENRPAPTPSIAADRMRFKM
jgi:hypothetical protein